MASSDTHSEELAFRVVYVSGDDTNGDLNDQKFADSDLLRTKQWTSNKYCHYPQEMILKFKKKVNLEKIQILSHSILVSQKVELFVGNPASGQRVSMSSAKYKRLGFVSFQNNKDEKSRELKSIYVDADGYFLKFLIHENYKSQKLNPFNQVGIMKITVLGYYLPEKDSDQSEEEDYKPKIKGASASVRNRNDFPQHEEKSYTTEMREIQKVLEKKKKEAVTMEKFDFAKRLKSATDRLRKATDDIDRLDRDKREAVEEEDFDRAQDCKDEIQGIRSSTYSDISLLELLTDREKEQLGLKQKYSPPQEERSPKPVRKPEEKPKPVKKPEEREKPVRKPETPNRSRENSGHRRAGSANRANAYNRKEDTVLPAIESKRRNSIPNVDNGSPESEPDRLPPISPEMNDSEAESNILQSLPDRDRSEVSQAINVFGIDTIRNIYSKNWEQRKAGLEQLRERLQASSNEQKDKASYLLMPALQVLKRGLKDKVFAVYRTALDVLKYILGTYLPHHKLQKTGGKDAAERTHYVIITRTGDSIADPRFRQGSIEFLDETVKTSEPPISRAFVGYILRPFQATGFPKIDQGHAEAAERIVIHQNAPNEKIGLDEHRVCGFALSCIQHTDPDVRQAGARMMIHMYSNGNKETVRQYLPPEGSKATTRNPLFKALFDEIDIIDGKQPRSQKNKAPPRGGQKNQEAENVKALQKQNKELKDALAKSQGSGGTTANRPKSGSRRRSLNPANQRPSIQVTPPDKYDDSD